MRRLLLLLLLVVAGCASDDVDTAADVGESTPSSTTPETDNTATPESTAAPTTISEATTTTTATAPTTTTASAGDSTDTEVAGTPAECTLLTDFTGSNEAWRAVNDGVMGGRSEGGPSFADGTMIFAGEINTNGGGFSSVRALLGPGTLTAATSIRVVGQPDSRTYKLVLGDAAEGRDRRVSHQGELVFEPVDEDTPGEAVAVVPLDALETSVFGQLVFTEPFVPELAVELGIQIADGIDGPFELSLTRLERCG